MNKQFKQDKGTAGLTILLSVIVMLFIIGLIVMIFSLMGTELMDATATEDTTVVVANESISVPSTAGITLAGGSARNGICGTVVLTNGTAGTVITAGNYTQTDCVLTNKTGEFTAYTTPYASYSYTWSADNTATDVMNETASSISEVTDWFDIFIVITAMVVLILLTVIIITAIRSSGMVASKSSNNISIGTA